MWCNLLLYVVNDEHCQLLGTEEDSSDKHSSNDDEEDQELLTHAQVRETVTLTKFVMFNQYKFSCLLIDKWLLLDLN